MTSPAGPSSMGMNTVTTVMAFSVSAFFVLFVFTRLFCARIHLRAAAAEHAAAAQASDAVSFPAIHVERGIRGMEPSMVTTFPTAKFGTGDDSQRPPAQEESQCTVCLEEYEAKDVVRVLPYCGHAFHAACIDTWLRQHPTCPICRSTTKHRAAAGTMPPVYYAVAMAPPPFQAPTSSSDQGALQQADAATAAVGAEHMDVTSSRLELEIVISDESASSGATCPIATLAPPFQVPTSSSDHDALREANPATASVTAAVGTDRMDVLSTRLEIVISDEPASSDAPCQSTASEEHPCAETRRQSSQGNAWEHRQC
ncbi:hypothetical protein CFC21_054161 [Triticum aestivum]|uniref:RING-type E3 ubiquitin transferase n=4 Tax=Triticum TaxID=4564 RepID=A0A9R0SKQ3_TRITD|nr:RING-H2 finger protein ATL2-like isoform X2 [Triticum dicoccoides]XP_044360885.1 RING-H2 finger protein ATL2-like isoform X2 [Triticum aestivum]XP_048573914.1 RING-H2 finger protein ATL2-like isoform X2 [Triticum urartu]KAF7045012.1 hypothetical protein CFC21_054161 [Triticum aestivum]VAH96893.1 unnamed protein product [Triticum turgidum subsp. durum]